MLPDRQSPPQASGALRRDSGPKAHAIARRDPIHVGGDGIEHALAESPPVGSRRPLRQSKSDATLAVSVQERPVTAGRVRPADVRLSASTGSLVRVDSSTQEALFEHLSNARDKLRQFERKVADCTRLLESDDAESMKRAWEHQEKMVTMRQRFKHLRKTAIKIVEQRSQLEALEAEIEAREDHDNPKVDDALVVVTEKILDLDDAADKVKRQIILVQEMLCAEAFRMAVFRKRSRQAAIVCAKRRTAMRAEVDRWTTLVAQRVEAIERVGLDTPAVNRRKGKPAPLALAKSNTTASPTAAWQASSEFLANLGRADDVKVDDMNELEAVLDGSGINLPLKRSTGGLDERSRSMRDLLSSLDASTSRQRSGMMRSRSFNALTEKEGALDAPRQGASSSLLSAGRSRTMDNVHVGEKAKLESSSASSATPEYETSESSSATPQYETSESSGDEEDDKSPARNGKSAPQTGSLGLTRDALAAVDGETPSGQAVRFAQQLSPGGGASPNRIPAWIANVPSTPIEDVDASSIEEASAQGSKPALLKMLTRMDTRTNECRDGIRNTEIAMERLAARRLTLEAAKKAIRYKQRHIAELGESTPGQSSKLASSFELLETKEKQLESSIRETTRQLAAARQQLRSDTEQRDKLLAEVDGLELQEAAELSQLDRAQRLRIKKSERSLKAEKKMAKSLDAKHKIKQVSQILAAEKAKHKQVVAMIRKAVDERCELRQHGVRLEEKEVQLARMTSQILDKLGATRMREAAATDPQVMVHMREQTSGFEEQVEQLTEAISTIRSERERTSGKLAEMDTQLGDLRMAMGGVHADEVDSNEIVSDAHELFKREAKRAEAASPAKPGRDVDASSTGSPVLAMSMAIPATPNYAELRRKRREDDPSSRTPTPQKGAAAPHTESDQDMARETVARLVKSRQRIIADLDKLHETMVAMAMRGDDPGATHTTRERALNDELSRILKELRRARRDVWAGALAGAGRP